MNMEENCNCAPVISLLQNFLYRILRAEAVTKREQADHLQR